MCRSTGSSTRAACRTQLTNVPRASRIPTTHPHQIGQQLLHPAQREVLLLDEVDRERPHAWAILRPAGHCGRKRADTDVRAVGAAHMHRLMLRHYQAHHRRQFMHLPPLAQHHRGVAQRRLALLTHRRAMLHHRVGSGQQMQRLALMAELSTQLLAALHAQALRLAFEAVAAGRLAAVVAVLGQASFQLLHTRQQRHVLLAQLDDGGFQFGDAFLGAHASMLHPLGKSA